MKNNKFVFQIPGDYKGCYTVGGENIYGIREDKIEFNLVGHFEYGKYIIPFFVSIPRNCDTKFRDVDLVAHINYAKKGIQGCIMFGGKAYEELGKHDGFVKALAYHEIAHLLNTNGSILELGFFDEYMCDRFAVAHIGSLQYAKACECYWDILNSYKMLKEYDTDRIRHSLRFKKYCRDILKVCMDPKKTLQYLEGQDKFDVRFRFDASSIIEDYKKYHNLDMTMLGYVEYRQYIIPILLSDNADSYYDVAAIQNRHYDNIGAIIIGQGVYEFYGRDLKSIKPMLYYVTAPLIDPDFFATKILSNQFAIFYVGAKRLNDCRAAINPYINALAQMTSGDISISDIPCLTEYNNCYDKLGKDDMRIRLV